MEMSDNPTKYEVVIEQYLRSILDISDGYAIGLFEKVVPEWKTIECEH